MDNKLILVLYVGVGNMLDEDVDQYVRRVRERLCPTEVIKNLDATLFVIPRRNADTIIECINPNYVVDEKLYNSYNEKLKNLVSGMDNNQFTKTQDIE
jgi:hypothetical protein